MRFILALLIGLWTAPSAWALSCSEVIVCTSGGCDYQHLNDASAYMTANCSTLSAPAEVKICGNTSCDDTGSSIPDTTAALFSGVLTTATNNYVVRTYGSARHDGTANKSGAYSIQKSVGEYGYGIKISFIKNFLLDGVVVDVTAVTDRSAAGIHSYSDNSANFYITVDNSIVYYSGASPSSTYGFAAFKSQGHVGSYHYYHNNIAYGFHTTHVNNDFKGFEGGSPTRPYEFFNNTAYNNDIGVASYSSTYGYLAKNTLSCGNDLDYYGDSTTYLSGSTNNLSCDNTAPALNTYYRSKTISFVSTTPGSEDLHLVSGDTDAIDHGADLSATFTTDIDGQTRSGTWDIGADEYVATSSGVPMATSWLITGQRISGMRFN